MILFCLPYAGGSSVAYHKWKSVLDSNIKLQPVELMGRGSRYNDGFYTDFEEAVDDVYMNIKDKIVDEEYAIFGHSMGSMLAFELYYKIIENGGKVPKCIFFSGCKAPQCHKKNGIMHKLPDSEFMSEVIKLGGTPIEVIENKELYNLVIPILRNDFRILETHEYMEKNKSIQCDITILSGREDKITFEELNEWRKYSSKNTRIVTFKGGHFFINDNVDKIISLIESTLL